MYLPVWVTCISVFTCVGDVYQCIYLCGWRVSVYLPVWVTCISVFTCVGGSDIRVSVYLPVWVTCISVFTCVGDVYQCIYLCGWI